MEEEVPDTGKLVVLKEDVSSIVDPQARTISVSLQTPLLGEVSTPKGVVINHRYLAIALVLSRITSAVVGLKVDLLSTVRF